jgi:hypothetical protein
MIVLLRNYYQNKLNSKIKIHKKIAIQYFFKPSFHRLLVYISNVNNVKNITNLHNRAPKGSFTYMHLHSAFNN